MRVGRQRAALPGLEIHHVVADRAAAKRQRRLARLVEQREVDAEALVGGFGAGDRLEHEVDRRALADQLERRRDVRQHAGLRRDVELDPDVVEHRQQTMRALRAVGRGVDADHGVARAEQQAVENARRDAARIVGRMIGLQPHREPAGQADRAAERGHHPAFRRHHHQVLQAADLAHRRRHLRRDAGRERREHLRSWPRPRAASRGSRRPSDVRPARRPPGRGCRRSGASPRRSRRGRRALAGASRAARRPAHIARRRAPRRSPRRGRPADRRCATATPWPAALRDRRTCNGELRWSRCTSCLPKIRPVGSYTGTRGPHTAMGLCQSGRACHPAP